MSILSTNTKLIKVGQEYSAGSGISIDDYVISVTGDVGGKTYSAGENINIYEQDNQLYISGKDWEQDIANASANAYNAATAQIPTPFDPAYLSAQIDNKLNESDFTAWQSGQYSTDLQTIEGQINNKLDSSSFSDVSGNFLTAINIPESATWNETSNVVKESSANWDNTSDLVKESSASWNQGKTYEGISPIVVNNDENKVSAETWTFSAGSNVSFVDDNVNKITRIDVTAQGGDAEVNSFVYDNSATILDVDSSYKANSANFYPSNNPSGFITGVDLSNFYTKDETSGKEELANAFANIPAGDTEVNSYVHSHSASIDNTSDLVQANSSTWNDVTVFQSNSGSYLTAVDLTPYQTTAGMVDYAKASALDNLTNDYDSLSSNVNSNSGTWNDVVNKLYISSYHELSAGTNIDIQGYVISSKDWTDNITQASSYAFNEATALIPTLTFHYVEI